MKNKMQMLWDIAAVVLGNFLYALTVKLFLLPTHLITGGTMGLALTANHYWGVDINLFVLVFNVLMLLLGLVTLGKGFAATTVLSTFLTPGFMELLDRTMGQVVLSDDPMLNAFFCGIGIGVSLGMVIRAGASTGGCDVPTILIAKHLRVSLGAVVYVWDMGILLLQMGFSHGEAVLYGVFMAVVYTVVMDKMLLIGTDRTEVKIISEKSSEISDAIQKRVDRGVTLLHGEGGYLRQSTKLVLTVVSNRELGKVEQIVHEIDPTCFLVVSRVGQVRGRGFSLDKDYSG